MRSWPEQWVLDLFDKHLDRLANGSQPFGILDVLVSMEEESFFPCNFMQVQSCFRPRTDERMEKAGWTAERAESGNEMIGPYKRWASPGSSGSTPKA